VELNTFERVMLLNILPAEGDLTTLRIVRKLREDLSFSEEEHKELELNQDETGKVTWRSDKDKNKEVEIGAKALGVIRSALDRLNKEKKLRDYHLGLCDRFEVE
jgi:hypothetical protein